LSKKLNEEVLLIAKEKIKFIHKTATFEKAEEEDEEEK
jgi:hypothetical protein